jgi:hypothetical protein
MLTDRAVSDYICATLCQRTDTDRKLWAVRQEAENEASGRGSVITAAVDGRRYGACLCAPDLSRAGR